MKIGLLYFFTAIAEIAGCYSVYLWLRQEKPVWWLGIAGISLAAFAWLLSLHPSVNPGRVYAAYGGVYIVVSLLWLWGIEGKTPNHWDLLGSGICLVGAAVIYFGNRS